MTDEPKNSADLVGHVLDATSQLARSRRRFVALVIVILLGIIGVLGYFYSNSIAGNHNKEGIITALQNKSAEQTIAEIQLREDVNSVQKLNKALKNNHTSALAVYCSIAVTIHDTLPPVALYCPKP